jgi:hypothetical protein
MSPRMVLEPAESPVQLISGYGRVLPSQEFVELYLHPPLRLYGCMLNKHKKIFKNSRNVEVIGYPLCPLRFLLIVYKVKAAISSTGYS